MKAAALAHDALRLDREIGDRSGEAAALVTLARSERALQRLNDARASIESALSLIETQRTEFLRQDLRTAYFATKQDAYSFAIDLLMTLARQNPSGGYAEMALESSERSRARVLLEAISDLRMHIESGADPGLLIRQRSIIQQLNAQTEQVQRLSGKGQEAALAAARKKLEDLLAEFEEVRARETTGNPRSAALTQGQPLHVQEIRETLLDGRTMLLEYFLGEERGFAWLVAKDGLHSAEIPRRAAIASLVERYRQALTARNDTPAGETRAQRGTRLRSSDQVAKHSASELSRILLQPFAGNLGAARLLIVADGPLHYVPFGALPSPEAPGKPLVLSHQIVNLPSASVMKLLSEDAAAHKNASKGTFLVADPVYEPDDPRVQPGACARVPDAGSMRNDVYPRLRFSRVEAEAIGGLATPGTISMATDFAASRALLENQQLSRYRILHFATHTEIDNERPLLSRIVLSQVDRQGCPRDGLIRLYEIYNLRLNADLVVLSGCRTAVGKEVRGEGLIGLTRGFLYAGASAVVASLWSVEDSATAELMRRFYERLLRKSMAPAAALHEAQASMCSDPHWSNPNFWAAFTVQGAWK